MNIATFASSQATLNDLLVAPFIPIPVPSVAIIKGTGGNLSIMMTTENSLPIASLTTKLYVPSSVSFAPLMIVKPLLASQINSDVRSLIVKVTDDLDIMLPSLSVV